MTTDIKVERPAVVTNKMLEYLYALRASRITNMFGAAPYVEENFGVSIKSARVVLSYWMETFDEASPLNARFNQKKGAT